MADYTPLKGSEWDALRRLIVAFDTLMQTEDPLKKRLKGIKNGWRDYRMVQTVMGRLMEEICDTIPTEKLVAIRDELQNSRITLEVMSPGWSGKKPHGAIYLDDKAYERLVSRAMQLECFMCDKCGKEVKKCKLHKDIVGTLHYEPDEIKDGMHCELAGRSTILEEE